MARNRNKRCATSLVRGGNSTGWRRESERSKKQNMLSQAQRTTILELSAKGVTRREIARVLKLSRLTVRKVLQSNSTKVPEIQRVEKAEPYRQQILDLLISCKGNLVRVHEELTAGGGAAMSYPALTAFCRRQGIGQTPVLPAGHYHFDPGEEMQHDTSPHEVEVGGRKYKAQTASAVLCYSRLLFFQIYPTFQRFDCKVFLTDALRYMGGAASRVMIDNTHVVVLRGTGREMIPVPEMEAFGERFGFRFVAHQIGNANRSARVERPFSFIENNFLAGRTFSNWEDLNQRARQWCDKVNSTYKKHIRAVPRELFAVERLHLKPLPAWIPEVYRLHQRTVDVEGYVSVNSIRYSVPVSWIGRRVEVRETRAKIEIELDARHLVTHIRAVIPQSQRITLAEHRPPRGEGVKRSDPHPEEQAILQAAPEIAVYVTALKQKGRKVVALALRQLLRLLKEYPREPFLAAVREAAQYGLYDLDRLERMILRRVARDYFLLREKDSDPHD
jgi:transposase